jgi:hypothetical protein
LSVFLIQISYKHRESFVNYPEQVDPQAPIKSNPDIDAANNNYASLLMFIKSNPSKSTTFIKDIKQKFFNKDCSVKDDIDFNNIAQLPLGVTFN